MKKILVLIIAFLALGFWFWYQTSNQSTVPLATEKKNLENGARMEPRGPLSIVSISGVSHMGDSSGFALYFNQKDENRSEITSTCDALCEKTWAPYLLSEAGTALTGNEDPLLSRLNLFTRKDGKVQFAWGTALLYRFSGDKAPGEMNANFSDGWTVLKP